MFSKESYREKVKEKARRQELRETGGMPRAAGFHRFAYHKNFEGWTEVKRVGLNGKVGIERVYTGKYYEPALEMRHRIELRLLYLLLIAGSTALYAFTATRTAYCNNAFYVGIFQGLTAVLMLWVIYVMLFYAFTPGKMTIGDYNTIHKPMYRSALSGALSMWTTGCMAVISFFVRIADRPYTDLLCALGFAASGTLLFFLYLIEHNLSYRVLKNETEAPADGSEIE